MFLILTFNWLKFKFERLIIKFTKKYQIKENTCEIKVHYHNDCMKGPIVNYADKKWKLLLKISTCKEDFWRTGQLKQDLPPIEENNRL